MLGVKTAGGYVSNFLRDLGMVLVLTVMLFAASSMTWLFQWFQQEFVVKSAAGAPRWLYWVDGRIQRVAVDRHVLLRLSLRAPPAPAGVGGGDRRPAGRHPVGSGQAGSSASTSARSRVYDQIYGPLSVLVVFVMFVYYSASVFVFGAAYVASLDSRRRA